MTNRALLFWGVCFPTRLAIARVAYEGNSTLRLASAAVAFAWLTGSVSTTTGSFGGPAFWADERPIHGALWGAYTVTGDYRFLLADATFGAINWLNG